MLKNRVLIFGLGILGGGLGSVEYFIKNKYQLKITDLKTEKQLSSQIKKISKIAKKYNYQKKIEYILGAHSKKYFRWADIIVVNPAISYKNELVRYSLKNKKLVINDCYLFFKEAKGDIIAITGTRGKTTTTLMIYQLFKNYLPQQILLGGNQPNKSLLKIIDQTKPDSVSILELSSFQLEFYQQKLKAPKIAIITNIYEDHLNRYKNMEEYIKIKANIFLNQKEDDFLILNYDNSSTKYFLKLKPQSKIYFVSLKELPQKLNGLFPKENYIIFKDSSTLDKINFDIKKIIKKYGVHNANNFLTALLTLYLYAKYKNLNLKKQKIKNCYKFLSLPPFRQEIVLHKNNLLIVNDSASTAPQATIEAIKRFAKKNINLILITGGTDKNLSYYNLALLIKEKINPKNLIILQGSGSNKLIYHLDKLNYNFKKEQIVNNLKDCLKIALTLINKKNKNIILFSPGAASFEKFKNEFDRGKKFNNLIKNILK